MPAPCRRHIDGDDVALRASVAARYHESRQRGFAALWSLSHPRSRIPHANIGAELASRIGDAGWEANLVQLVSGLQVRGPKRPKSGRGLRLPLAESGFGGYWMQRNDLAF